MTKVPMEKAQEFLRLHKDGHSYVEIAKDNNLNNKTVSDRVRWAEDFNNAQHWNEIGKDLDTRHMQEHHQMLLAAARGVLTAVSTLPRLVGDSQLAQVLVETQVFTRLQNLEEILASRGINVISGEPGDSADGDWDLLRGMAVKLHEGLLQHLPELKTVEDRWASYWQQFRDEKDVMVEETATVLIKRVGTVEEANRLASEAVNIVLGDGNVNIVNEDQPVPELIFAVDQAEGRSENARKALVGLRASVTDCRTVVEEVVLRGGPPGRCHSCPGGLAALKT